MEMIKFGSCFVRWWFSRKKNIWIESQVKAILTVDDNLINRNHPKSILCYHPYQTFLPSTYILSLRNMEVVLAYFLTMSKPFLDILKYGHNTRNDKNHNPFFIQNSLWIIASKCQFADKKKCRGWKKDILLTYGNTNSIVMAIVLC